MCLFVMEDIRGPSVITEGSVILFKGNKEYEVNKKLIDVVINVLEYSN